MSELSTKVTTNGSIFKLAVAAVIIAVVSIVSLNSFFYAEPGYIYHVRTVLGDEEVVTEVGYKFYPFGRYNSWKRAMTVQAIQGASGNAIRAEKDSDNTSASLPPMSIMFLDQVDAHAQATVRFAIPSDKESF
ncbi:hypothetical protein [Aliikangiella marina]|uniref:hypothetical protein n=1 Tax=Aliikangiella marina TaxID=1712262 RepID=UPI001FE2A7FD|nr:hypothetical protein [Aliikangiella marina]